MEITDNPNLEVYHRVNASGQLELVNMLTGEVMPVAHNKFKYTLEYGDAICNLVREGKTFAQISKQIGIPTHTIYHWRTLHPDFNQRLLAARADRADFFHNKIVEVVENLDDVSEDRSSMEKLKIDSYKWLAGVDNPDIYGNKTKISGDPNAPLQIILDTGIRRDALPDASVPAEVVSKVEKTETDPPPSLPEKAGEEAQASSDEKRPSVDMSYDLPNPEAD